MSKQGVYDQLMQMHDCTPEAAQYAVDHINADWNGSALAKAYDYLEFSAFSQQGLYDQLTSTAADEFTAEEAQYAVDNVDADWNAEALEAAENYYNTMQMTGTELYNQLVSAYADKFTPEQAQYAVDNLDPEKLDAQ